MRVALAGWSRRVVGGAEVYVGRAARALAAAGHDVALLAECDLPVDGPLIALPDETATWILTSSSPADAFAALRDWRPDVIYNQGVRSATTELPLLEIAPAFYFAHDYYGACISAEKTHKFPHPTPCHRPLGWPCLLHYYPHRCGGLSPVTMIKDFRLQRGRQARLQRYAGVLVASRHMRDEMIREGRAPERVHVVPMPLPDALQAPARSARRMSDELPCRIAFAGRIDRLKGVHVLLEALPLAARALGRRLELTVVGDGPYRARIDELAAQVQASEPQIEVRMTGWVERARATELVGESDVLVVPSLWPEPYGLVGPEAMAQGIPVVAFDVGGISEWLHDDVNGQLAPGDRPTAAGLADAIVRALADEAHHDRLSRGALDTASELSSARHAAALLEVFEREATSASTADAR